MRLVYRRFVVPQLIPGLRFRTGLYHGSRELRDAEDVRPEDRAELMALREWFNEHLAEPTQLSISSQPHKKAQALSWFKLTATEHIAKMQAIADLMRAYNRPSTVLETNRPGYIVYEDEHQIAAYPFNDTPF